MLEVHRIGRTYVTSGLGVYGAWGLKDVGLAGRRAVRNQGLRCKAQGWVSVLGFRAWSFRGAAGSPAPKGLLAGRRGENDMGVCQNYGPFLGPYYNMAPNI